MNRNRLHQMRQMDRGNEGLQQVIQMQSSAAGAQGQPQGQAGAQGQTPASQAVRRKTTYTRTEMLSRGLPTAPSYRNGPPAGQDWINQLSPKPRYATPPKAVVPATPLGQSTNATNKNNTPRRQRSFLPRVARLPAKSDRSPNRMQNRLGRETEGKLEQSHIPVGTHKPMHLVNSPQDSDSSSPTRRTMMAQGDGLVSDNSTYSERHKIKLAKAIRLPDDQNKSFVYLCKPVKKVKELLTARRLRNSCEQVNEANEGDFLLEELQSTKLQLTLSEEAVRSKGGSEEYGSCILSPIEGLTQSSSSTSQLDSPTLEAMQQRQQQFEAKAMSSQERLKNRLLEVRQRQRHLLQLEHEQRHKEQRQLELDQVCQNLPALQHEIRMLQQLSEKLEATLRVSNIPKPSTPKKRSSMVIGEDLNQRSSTRFYTPRTSPYQPDELPITKLCCLSVEQIVERPQRARSVAMAHHFGLVQEFRVETKTLNELKTGEDSQYFYLPAPREEPSSSLASKTFKEADPLQPTNFRKLRENPNILLQQLRPLIAGAGKPFNLLDQDTMFFNSLAYGESSKPLVGSTAEQLEAATRETGLGGGGGSIANYGGAIAYSRLSVRVNEVARSADQGDQLCASQVHNTTQTELQSPRKNKIPELEPETEISSPDYTPNPSPRLVKRKKLEEVKVKIQEPDPKPKKSRPIIRRVAPQSPIGSRVEPKVRLQLLKTVLVGMVQVAVILVLIMAFTYPDVSC
ncbi:uncharacterized protein LOC108032505 [Drosophila biarmipes]|uniref:uncharacterized protein LOC108032505 n=1 Tax=Drosophila biarmipes TaxID=125945 RepID=UPI0007E64F94|nr:uncharacterized protein LOC108032505 [Drosophila biarmipes]